VASYIRIARYLRGQAEQKVFLHASHTVANTCRIRLVLYQRQNKEDLTVPYLLLSEYKHVTVEQTACLDVWIYWFVGLCTVPYYVIIIWTSVMLPGCVLYCPEWSQWMAARLLWWWPSLCLHGQLIDRPKTPGWHTFRAYTTMTTATTPSRRTHKYGCRVIWWSIEFTRQGVVSRLFW